MAIIARQEITIAFVVDIKETYRYYLLQDSTLDAPSKPTTYPPNSKWSLTEPSYSEGSIDNLYVVECTVFTNDTFSYSSVSLSSSYEAAKAAYNKALDAESSAGSAKDDVTDLSLKVIDSETEMMRNCEEIVAKALTVYGDTGDLGEFKKTVQAQLKLLSDSMTLKFEQTEQDLRDANNSLQDQLSTISKYFTFDINGLTIGQVENPYKVVIDNDRYSMIANGVEVMWIADGKVHTPEIEITNRFSMFGYSFEQDSSGNVNCEYVGGE